MPLEPGAQFGPYEILAPLGAGGMGEVYRAKDTRLDRAVALKVLPQHLAADPDLRQRFDREARAVSSLNHPHICALFDVGHQDGIDYIVMELLEGETLADRLSRGPLPTEQVLRYGIEIADALDKAHRQGIVHRDLKPGNVMLTKAGAKLLDFGLAKLQSAQDAPAASMLSALATSARPLTEHGTVLGTFQYMAPEQLEAKEADARSDLFALSSLLYEMATGKRAFTGKSQASLIAAILSAEPPPLASVQPMTPPALDRLVKVCLAKDPDDRLQTAHDVMQELKWIVEAGSAAGVPAPVAARRKSRERLAWSAFAVAALAALLGGVLLERQARESPRTFQSSILPPEKLQFNFDRGPMAVSPDGRRIAFVAQPRDGASLLWVRPFDAPSAQPLAGTEGASYPFWSPDSRYLGFFAEGRLKRIDASGGPPQTLCDARSGRGGTWNREGVILFAPSNSDPIHRVAAAGGAASPVTQLEEGQGDISQRAPVFLPDGRHFFYAAWVAGALSQEGAAGIYLGSLDSKDRRLLLHARANVAYAPPLTRSSQGHLLFLRDRTLLAQPFDAKRLELTGEAFPVAEQVQYFGAVGTAAFSVSENGTLVYQTGAGQLSQLVWFDRDGKQLESLGPTANYAHPRLSHDGRRVAVVIVDQTAYSDIWLLDLPRRVSTRLTFGPAMNLFPIWSPDDSRIAFSSTRKGFHDLYQKAASGAGDDELLLGSPTSWEFASDWSQDGALIALQTRTAKSKGGLDLGVFSVGDRKVTPLLSTPFDEWSPQFSPDGRWLAYSSDQSGTREVYVRAFPAFSSKWQISSAGGAYPRWQRDGSEIFYVGVDKRLMAAEIKAGPDFEAGVPRPLFSTQIKSNDIGFQYDVSPDGKRFLINAIAAEEQPSAITVVQNWAAELKK